VFRRAFSGSAPSPPTAGQRGPGVLEQRLAAPVDLDLALQLLVAVTSQEQVSIKLEVHHHALSVRVK
jgi:hypothetical protein